MVEKFLYYERGAVDVCLGDVPKFIEVCINEIDGADYDACVVNEDIWRGGEGVERCVDIGSGCYVDFVVGGFGVREGGEGLGCCLEF